MKLFLPTIGSRLVLSKPWTFRLKDEYKNTNFWTAIHGAPVRQSRWYGYDPITGNKSTSPVKTTLCDRQETYATAPPILTTLPKGTTLIIEQIFIRKGMREYDAVSFRIPKGGSSGLPASKFLVPLKEVNNKLDAVVDMPTKYPQGKFTISTRKGNEYLTCVCRKYPCVCPKSTPSFIREYLVWQSIGEGSRSGGIVANIEHYRNTAGKDEMAERTFGRYYRDESYTKSFDKIENLLEMAKTKGFTDAHIQAFLDAYQIKKDEWETEKAIDAA